MANQLGDISNNLSKLINGVSPFVVAIHGGRGMGSSGVHWKQGLIIAADHSLPDEEELDVFTAEGGPLRAKMVGRDAGTDLALLRVEGLKTPEMASGAGDAARAGDAGGSLHVGDIAMVVGRSKNSGPNSSFGIISAVSGPWRTWRGGELDLYLRLSAEIFAGSEGGAVIDSQGRLIGIASSALSRVAGLVIPASTVNRVLQLLLEKGSVPRPYLGVALQPIRIPESFRQKLSVQNESGVMVVSVEPEGPAEAAGILVGDILLNIDGNDLSDAGDLHAQLHARKIGMAAELRLIRGGESRNSKVVIGERVIRRSGGA